MSDAVPTTTPGGGSGESVPPGVVTVPDEELLHTLEALRTRLSAVELPLAVPGADEARRERAATLDQLDDYLLPRLRARSAPLLVVVGGSTGAGKSTLVNSLLGTTVSAPGVLRPTTRSPVLVHHPLDRAWFAGERVLPGLPRALDTAASTAGPAREGEPGAGAESTAVPAPTGVRGLRLVASTTLPRGMALLDAPDVDSVETANRQLAAQLLAAADLWVFVTTAARYADAVPWDLLRGAAERHAQVALVVDRVDEGASAVVDDLRRLMGEQGLGAAPLFVVPEGPLVGGLLPETAIGPIATWLTALGADEPARRAVAEATRDGVVDDVVRRADVLARAADLQVEAAARLRTSALDAYHRAGARVADAASDGALLRGEVLERWQELVGTGEFFRAMEQNVGRARDALARFVRGRPAPVPPVEHALAHGLAVVILDAADEAAEGAHAAWRSDPAGAALLSGLDLARSSAGLRERVTAQVRAWQGDVLGLVREQGAARRGTARALSLGVNALGVSLMVVVFSATGGLTGVEVGIAGGTAVLAQRLLEAVFGDDAVRRLTVAARARLEERVTAVLADEAQRYTSQLDALGLDGPAPHGRHAGGAESAGDALRAAGRAVAAAARTERVARSVTGGVDERGLLRVGGAEAGSRPARAAASGYAGQVPGGADAPAWGDGRLRGAGRVPADPGAAQVVAGPVPTRRSWWRRLRRGGGSS